MRHQSREAEAREKRSKPAARGSKTGSREREPDIMPRVTDDLLGDDIDPADLFDPEEFGIRRHIEPLGP